MTTTAYTSHSKSGGSLQFIRQALENSRLGDLLLRKDYISSEQLNSLLQQQQSKHISLGKLCVQHGIISRFELFGLLMTQKSLRYTASAVLFFASCSAFSKKANAQGIRDIPARVALQQEAQAFQRLAVHPAIFNSKEKRSNNISAFTKWTGMFDRFEKALNTNRHNAMIQKMKIELATYQSSSIYDMARNVNDMMNRTKYITDTKNWGKSDYWATPIEFMTRGGDCEDFAIAKYTALRAMGVPENRMRIAIVQDEQKNIPHAILIVYTERGAMVLDNQIKTMRSTERIAHYKPIFSINRDAWWLHTVPQQTRTIVASAR